MFALTKLLLKYAIVSGLFVVASANSQQIWHATTPYGQGYGSSPDYACKASIAKVIGKPGFDYQGTKPWTETGGECLLFVNGFKSAGTYILHNTCPPGKVPDYTTGQCQDQTNECEQLAKRPNSNGDGHLWQQETFAFCKSVYIAFGGSGAAGAYDCIEAPREQFTCAAGCAITRVGTEGPASYEEAGDYYRIMQNTGYKFTGQQCPGQQQPQPTPTPQSCDGYSGQINGRDVCLSKYPAPPAQDPRWEPIPHQSTQPKEGQEPPSNPPPDVPIINPPVPLPGGGIKPGTGTPVTDPPGSTEPGTGDGDQEQGNFCQQFPNVAVCKEKVPIDETGTPSTTGTLFDSAIQQLDQSKDLFLDLFTDAASSDGKNTQWSFTFSLPSSCQAIETPIGQTALTTGFKLDVCKYQPVIHDLMAMVWIGGTIWLLIGMFGNTLRSI